MPIQSNKSTVVVVDGKEYLYFGGTNYLGLAHHPELMQAAFRAFEKFGFSCGASRLTSGENDLLIALEMEMARFGLAQSALVMPTGFVTNAAVVDGLDAVVDFWIVARNAHGSISSAVAQSNKRVIVDDSLTSDTSVSLRTRHGLNSDCIIGIFAEPIDPLQGQLCAVPNILAAAAERDYIVLDEAHSVGVLGADGAGALQHFELQPSERLIRTGTFTKAFGACGGFILASTAVIDLIKQRSGHYKHSTPLTPLGCAASREALKLIAQNRGSTVDGLKTNVSMMNRGLVELGFGEFQDHCVPIFHLPGSDQTSKLRETLPAFGIYVPSMSRYFADTITTGFRWTIQAGHTEEQLDTLLRALRDYLI